MDRFHLCNSVLRLKQIIEQHLKQFKQLFTENYVIPKHRFFKQWPSKLNFRNVCKSLVNHNKLLECCQNEMGTKHPIFAHEKELGPVSEVTNMEYFKTKIRDFLGLVGIQKSVTVKSLILNGSKYTCERSLKIHQCK